MEEGTFDCRNPDVPDAREELAMAHSSAMVQHLLMRIERIEREVSGNLLVPYSILSDPSLLQLVDAKSAFNVLKARVDEQEGVSTRTFRSIGELESLGSDLSTTLGRQGLELVRLEESHCRCVPSDTGSYFTPGCQGHSIPTALSAKATP